MLGLVLILEASTDAFHLQPSGKVEHAVRLTPDTLCDE